MPQRPPRGCDWPLCKDDAVEGRYCLAHREHNRRSKIGKRYRRRPKKTRKEYGTARHKRWSRAVLARDRYCTDPYGTHAQLSEQVASKYADHIIEIEDGGTWALENGAGLCAPCHGRKTAQARRQRA